ncbi:hypothetical protein Nepgr_014857 [Nepenthes gracilis]|uniref:Uncharacterized protein n=1 Tax=Nepenthes gracilis TaxID=150966 RepID=A0AAD3SMK3_NEPGR|nr:hypothetical protein Nepgr_014857 [Nepenthes gracilis]
MAIPPRPSSPLLVALVTSPPVPCLASPSLLTHNPISNQLIALIHPPVHAPIAESLSQFASQPSFSLDCFPMPPLPVWLCLKPCRRLL